MRLSIHGILLLDKAIGISSNRALQEVKNLFNAKKAGHTGSLDPLATGMLPICFGEATKFSQFLLNADKRYYVVAKLGIKTTTGDREGEILEERSVGVINLENILPSFRGEIQQIPSMYSAIKHQGQPLYKLARQGIEVERKVRTVSIHDLTLLEQTADTLTFSVHCSKGTYVRTLVEDIGERLGCGAHITQLRRLEVSPYQESQMINYEQLKDISGLQECLLPIETLVQDFPKLSITDTSAFYLKQGQAVMVPHAPTSGWVALYLHSGKFLGMGEIQDDGKIAPKRLLNLSR